MKRYYLAYTDEAKVPDSTARLQHLQATARLGGSRNGLLNQIKAGARERGVKEQKTPFPIDTRVHGSLYLYQLIPRYFLSKACELPHIKSAVIHCGLGATP